MSEETVVTAARRLNRFFRIDMRKGGLVVDETLAALETLEYQLRRASSVRDALHDASREAARGLRLDTSDHGGMVSVDTQARFDIMDRELRTVLGIGWGSEEQS